VCPTLYGLIHLYIYKENGIGTFWAAFVVGKRGVQEHFWASREERGSHLFPGWLYVKKPHKIKKAE